MNLKTDAAGQKLIISHEAIVLHAYPDPATNGIPWTIGVGHTSAAGAPKVSRGLTITRAEALEILARDLAPVDGLINSVVTVDILQCQHNALASFTFNVGGSAFRNSTLLKKLNAGSYLAAADELLKWTKADGKVMSGLVTRRVDERSMFVMGEQQIKVSPNDAGEAYGVMLVLGSQHIEEVKALQKNLIVLGYTVGHRRLDGGQDPDGDFGPATKKAVEDFQAKHLLKADGKVGPATRSAIASALSSAGFRVALGAFPLPGSQISALA